MATKERPTGIIRTLPSLKDDSVGKMRYLASLKALENDQIEAIYIAMSQLPKEDVLHMYLIVEGHIKVRMNISHYVPGDERECWDREIRSPKYWAVCTGPVSRPDEPIKQRGFQGFRYTSALW